MALIEDFHETASDRNQIHGPVECGWRAFAVDGRQVLQLDTYGSRERKIQGKQSQSIQLDKDSAQVLVEILDRAFPSLTWPA